MTQIATVREVLSPGYAVVRVARKTACGHDCENCGGCGANGGFLEVTALCDFPVRVGDTVEVASGNGVLAIAALVYLVPLVLFLAGYLMSGSLEESMRYLCGGVGFGLGIVLAVICDRIVRRKKTVTYRVTHLL